MSVPIKKGDVVYIFNRTLGGKPVVEGAATVRKLLGHDFSGWPLAKVEFKSEPGELYRRVIWPGHEDGNLETLKRLTQS